MTESMIKQFQQLQEERVRTFHKLDDDHKVFLGHAPDYEEGFDDYKKAVNNCTEKFKDISKEIMKIKDSLQRDDNTNKLASLVGRVQELEETKLHTVVDLQLARLENFFLVKMQSNVYVLLRQQAFDNLDDPLCQKNADLIKAKLIKLEEEINETLTDIRYEVVDIVER